VIAFGVRLPVRNRPCSHAASWVNTRTCYSFMFRTEGGRLTVDWDIGADVVVVGFGGATALSGGIVYAGGGTAQQRAATRQPPRRGAGGPDHRHGNGGACAG
jgi:hypothetical protein